jgi:hypothetical protein
MKAMTTQKFLTVFAAVVAVQALFFYASFFANLHSTICEWAGSAVAWPVQAYYNLLHGRSFQSSIYASPAGGDAVGFVGNPYAFIHSFAFHTSVLIYLFAGVWALHPTLATLYGIIFAWNLTCGAGLTVLILKRLAPRDYRWKAVFALSVFFGAGLLSILDQFAQPLLFVGPTMLAAYYFFLARRRWWFLAAIAAMCLTGEDASMLAVTFAGYFFLFEPEDGRSYGLTAAAFAVPYMLAALLIVQPASRADLIVLSSTNMSHVFKNITALTPAMFAENFKTLWPLFTILPSFVMAGTLFGWPSASGAIAVAALGLVTAAPFWAEIIIRGGAHHNLPPFISSYLALLLMIGRAKADEAWLRRSVPAAALAATAIFLLFSLRVQANNLPNALKPALYRISGKAEKGLALERSLKVEKVSNLTTISAIKSLAPEKGVAYLTNNQAVGFFVDRSDIWQCGDTVRERFAFEQTDYFVVQKDAVNMTCCLDASAGPDYVSIVRKSPNIIALNCPMTPALLEKIRGSFVRAGTHRVAREDEHVLVLENLHPVRYVSPPETVGLGWTRNLFKKAAVAAPARP